MYVIFIIWLYLNCIMEIADVFISNYISTITRYSILIIFFVYILIKQKFVINKRIIYFFITYIMLVSLNVLLVDYPKYVIAEGVSNFLIFATPVLLISIPNFKLDILFEKWYTFAKYTILISIVLLLFENTNVLSYSIYSKLLLPSIIILLFNYFLDRHNKCLDLLILISMICILFVFGGRMAYFTSMLIFIFAILVIKKMSTKKRVLIFITLIFITLIFILNAKNILTGISRVCSMYNIESRTISLLEEQMKDGFNFKNIHLSNRGKVYSISLEYISTNWWRPSGLSVIRNLTNGEYYHPHNGLFQLIITFGLLPTIFILGLIVYKTWKLRKYENYEVFMFTLMLIISYFIRSITDTNIFVDFASIISIAILFFKEKPKVQQKILEEICDKKGDNKNQNER